MTTRRAFITGLVSFVAALAVVPGSRRRPTICVIDDLGRKTCFEIEGDGIHDDSAIFNEAMSLAGSSGGKIFLPPVTIRLAR